MEKETRNAIERATQRARKLLEDDFGEQLEGTFDILRNGTIIAEAGAHLSTRQILQREKIVASIEHKRACGSDSKEAVASYLRDAAFTTLNRFVALKMLEAREMVQECISHGEQSTGYREFCGLAPGVPLIDNSEGYRLFLESLFDELSTEVKVQFDRRDPSSVLWPRRTTFEQLLEIINAADISQAWNDDETIGWIYQFFNSTDERKKLRDESPTPRNSHEMAIRNQFFTPRFVVRFLTDNTLGRLWFEMQSGKSAVGKLCDSMLRKADAPILARQKKDPRDLRILDPACGSGHFLIYVFDLLISIYDEAWNDPEPPKSSATGRTLIEDFPSFEDFKKAVPALILAYNIHGVDIDTRCVQIAQLALWMRCQRAYQDLGLSRSQRPQIRKSNIVIAEPMTIDPVIAENFLAGLGDPELGHILQNMKDGLSLAGDLGLLLRLEKIISSGPKIGESPNLFTPPRERIRKALASFVPDGSRSRVKRRLFVGDVDHGLGLLQIAETKFDVVLMNPPFGAPTQRASKVLTSGDCGNLYSAFVRRAIELGAEAIGCITDRTFLTQASFKDFRREILSGEVTLNALCDLGWGVLDANVQTAAYVLLRGSSDVACVDVRESANKPQALRTGSSWKWNSCSSFLSLPDSLIAYALPPTVLNRVAEWPPLCDVASLPRGLGSNKAARTYLAWVEAPLFRQGNSRWEPLANGGDFSPWWREDRGVADWRMPNDQPWITMRSSDAGRPYDQSGSSDYFQPGLSFPKQSSSFNVAPLSAGCIPTREGKAILPKHLEDSWYLLAYLNCGVVRAFVRDTCGLHKQSGAIGRVPIPPFSESEKQALAKIALDLASRVKSSFEMDELSLGFTGPFGLRNDTSSKIESDSWRAQLSLLDSMVVKKFGLKDEEVSWVDSAAEPVFFRPSRWDLISWALGVTFGRFHENRHKLQKSKEGLVCTLARRPRYSPAMVSNEPPDELILVNDPGHANDITERVRETLERSIRFLGSGNKQIEDQELKDCFKNDFFAAHLDRYKVARRNAPIYWQLATPSATYSIWLYFQAVSQDTLFKVLNDYVAPKLSHEQRRLEILLREKQENATAADRKAINSQAQFVEELRAFLSEVKLVAPMWKPNIDDGVIITYSPLWRMVPHHKSWQRQLRATWNALCEGKYDWTHLAMHLWPERVVPKCANDRSLAIAHGIETIFWEEGSDGKAAQRNAPIQPVDDLVRERTSPAVKSALRALLDAPIPSGATKTSRKGKING